MVYRELLVRKEDKTVKKKSKTEEKIVKNEKPDESQNMPTDTKMSLVQLHNERLLQINNVLYDFLHVK